MWSIAVHVTHSSQSLPPSLPVQFLILSSHLLPRSVPWRFSRRPSWCCWWCWQPHAYVSHWRADRQTNRQTEERMLRILTDFMSQGKLELLNLWRVSFAFAWKCSIVICIAGAVTHQIRANGLLAQNNRQGEQETALEVPKGVYFLPFCALDVETFHLLTAWITTSTLLPPKRVFANENEHFTPSKLAFYYLAAPCNSDSFNINVSDSSFPSKKEKGPRQFLPTCCRRSGDFLNRCCCQDSSVKICAARDRPPSVCPRPRPSTLIFITHHNTEQQEHF